MNLSFFFSRLLLFAIVLESSTLQAQTKLSPDKLTPVLSQSEQFPQMVEQVLLYPPKLIWDTHSTLVDALENTGNLETTESRHPLLTLEIDTEVRTGKTIQFKVVKDSFISDWGQELSAFVAEHELNTTDQILRKISELSLYKPYLASTPHDFISALVQTLDRDVNREEIFRALQRGDLSVLENALDDYPKGRGFKPFSAFVLEPDREKDYYLGVLREIIEMNERMNQLVTVYIFASQMEAFEAQIQGYLVKSLETYLTELSEESLVWIMEKNLQKHFSKTIATTQRAEKIYNRVPPPIDSITPFPVEVGTRVVTFRRRILSRIKSIEREIKRHQEVVTERTQVSENKLTLVEVHPSIGVFRGYIGGDCSSSQCFGYPYSSKERVFFILNKRGEDVGYLNGAMVNTTVDGKKAFLVNGLAGARISKEMATIIFAGLSKSSQALGVDEVLILNQENHLSHLDYTEIRRAFESHVGAVVLVTFLDRSSRKVIDKYSITNTYDNPDTLSIGHRIENIEEIREGTSVTTSERPFESPQLENFKVSDLKPREVFFLNMSHPNIAQEWGIDWLRGMDSFTDRKLLELIQNVDRFSVHEYQLNLQALRRYFSVSQVEFNRLTYFDQLGGVVKAPDFFSSPAYEIVTEALEEVITEENFVEIDKYIVKVFPYVRGKRMGELVERTLNLVIEKKFDTPLMWFAHGVFPYAHVPNKDRMIITTIAAAVKLGAPDVLTELAHKTLPRIRSPRRKDIIDLVRRAAIAFNTPEILWALGTHNHLGDERGWRMLRSKTDQRPSTFDLVTKRITLQEYNRQASILMDYFSLTREQFIQIFTTSEFFEMWHIINVAIKDTIESENYEALERLKVNFFSAVKLEHEIHIMPPIIIHEFNTIKTLLHEFFNDGNRNWAKLRTDFQAATAAPDPPCF